MSDAVEQAESALRAFDEYWGDGGPVDAVHGRPFELIRALLAEVRASVVAEVRASVVAEGAEWEYGHDCFESRQAYGPAAPSPHNDWPSTEDCTNVTDYRRRKAGPWVPVGED